MHIDDHACNGASDVAKNDLSDSDRREGAD